MINSRRGGFVNDPAKSNFDILTGSGNIISVKDSFVPFLRAHPLFTKMDDADFYRMLPCFHQRKCRKDEVIILDSTNPDYFHIIVTGKVVIFKEAGTIYEELAVKGEGDFFGEMSLIDSAVHSASAKAMTETTLLSLDRTGFEMLVSSLDALRLMLQTVVNDLRYQNQKHIDKLKDEHERLKKTQTLLVLKEQENIFFDYTMKLLLELRNPIACIRGFTELLASEEDSGRIDREYVAQNVYKEIDIIDQVISDMLYLTNTGFKLSFTRVSMADFFREFASEAKSLVASRKISFSSNFDGAAEELFCDPHYLKKSLYHLVRNAISAVKAIDEPVISVSAYVKDTQAFFTVSDNGIGIHESVRERIFQYTYTTFSSFSRYGFGLPIAKKIIGEHRGKISYASKPNAGTCFTVEIPLS